VVTCPACGDAVDDDARFCESCGTALVPTTEGELCAHCGAQIASAPSGEEAFCDRCGLRQPRLEDHRETDLGSVAAATDRGKRHHRNEDAYGIIAQGDRTAAVVCDGVSTTPNPDVASARATAAAIAVLEEGILEIDDWPALAGRAVTAAQGAVTAGADQNHDALGSTTIVLALVGPGRVVVANVGDSRAYWIGDHGGPLVLTVDDSWAAGAIAAGVGVEEAHAHPLAHQITAWLGPDAEPVGPHVREHSPDEDGLVIVCSDGLWNYAESPEAVSALVHEQTGGGPHTVARRLVQAALVAGGADNVTVAVLVAPASGEPGPSRYRRN
jgi:serine/threonine protein phosphatase PrpC